MYLSRWFKTLPACRHLAKHSNAFSHKFCIQISQNYCSFSSSKEEMSNVKEDSNLSVQSDLVDSLVEKITSNIRQKHGPKYDYSFQDINSVIAYLLEYDVTHDQVLKLFYRQPSLCQHYRKSWEDTINVLNGNGIQGSDILKMLQTCPQLLKRNPAGIDETFICLRQYEFGGKRLYDLLLKTPELLVADAQFISQQIEKLMTLFTRKDILSLAVNSPQVLLEDFEDTEEKVQYIFHEIGEEQQHMVSNRALSHSLNHIRLRHQVMLRTGVYRKPHPKKKISNPRLSDMLDTPTKKFAENICRITMEEYEVFQEMLQREDETTSHLDMESASDSDNESESESEDHGT